MGEIDVYDRGYRNGLRDLIAIAESHMMEYPLGSEGRRAAERIRNDQMAELEAFQRELGLGMS